MRHGLGIAIFSVLSAVSLSVIGCGGTGSGMGVLDPFPTGTRSTPTGTSTPVPPTPDVPDNKAYDVVKTGDLRNPVYQYVDDSNCVYTVQGFTVGGAGMSDQQCKYRLLKYSTTDKEADPQEITIEIRNGSTYTKGDLENPYYITGIIDDMGTADDKTDDHLYLAVTDLGTSKAVYLMDLGAREAGWNKAKAVNLFTCGNELVATRPLTCSFGSSSFNRGENAINTLFYTDYTETGTVKFVAFDENIFKNGKLADLGGNIANCGNVFSGLTLSYPAVIKANEGPWVTVTCQGDNKIYFFANNTSLTAFKGDSSYPLGNDTNSKYINYIQPETKYNNLQNPYDFAWTSGVTDNDGENSQYLVISSGFALDKFNRASSASDKGALWIYKFDSKYADSLQNLRNHDGEYTLILDKLQYPVNVAFTNPSTQSDKRYLDIAYLTTGTSINHNVDDLEGTLSFCRYDAKNKKLVNKSDVDLLDKIVDPFGLVVLTGQSAETSYPTQFLFTTHWNWDSDFTEKSHIYSYSKDIDLEAGN